MRDLIICLSIFLGACAQQAAATPQDGEHCAQAAGVESGESIQELEDGSGVLAARRSTMPRLVAEERVRVTMTDDPALALARICVSEEGWSSLNGCTAIWQVVQNVRSRSCNTVRYRRISQCVRTGGEVFVPSPGVNSLDAQETLLSATRRPSSTVSRTSPPRSPR